jgi:hypothetical protein
MTTTKYFIPTEDNKYHVEDYPFGYRERCEMFYWFEFSKFGARMVRQSLKDGRYNKPKKSTYHKAVLAYLDENEHFQYKALSNYSEKEKENKFLSLMEEVENLPAEMQKLIDKKNGTETAINIPFKFSKINKTTYQKPVINLIFDCFDAVKFRQIYEAIKGHEEREQIFALDGGYIIKYRSNAQFFVDETVFNTYNYRFEAENNPFTFKEEKPEGAKNYTAIPKKKEQPKEERTLLIDEMTSKIESNLKKILPGGCYIHIGKYKGFAGEYIKIAFAAGEKQPNSYSRPQQVSLSLNFDKLELAVQMYGGTGGQSIEIKPENPHRYCQRVRIPFRKPQKTETKVLSYIDKFANNWLNALKENIDNLMHSDTVDYRELLK